MLTATPLGTDRAIDTIRQQQALDPTRVSTRADSGETETAPGETPWYKQPKTYAYVGGGLAVVLLGVFLVKA